MPVFNCSKYYIKFPILTIFKLSSAKYIHIVVIIASLKFKYKSI